MKFTFNLTDLSSSLCRQEKLVIDSAAGEMVWHVALKLLGHLLFRDWRPKIEADPGWHFKPDLYAVDETGKMNLWVDCGNIALRKIDSIATKVGRAVRFVILRKDAKEADRLEQSVMRKVRHAERVEFICFDDGFVDELSEALEGTNDLDSQLEGDTLRLALRNRSGVREWTTAIHRENSSNNNTESSPGQCRGIIGERITKPRS